MSELCTSCLVKGRVLHGIRDDGDDVDQLYRQILNELHVAEDSNVSAVQARLCWECRAVLRRFYWFKRHAVSAHHRLVAIAQKGGDVTSIARAPRLFVQCVAHFELESTDASVQVKSEPAPAEQKPAEQQGSPPVPEFASLPAAPGRGALGDGGGDSADEDAHAHGDWDAHDALAEPDPPPTPPQTEIKRRKSLEQPMRQTRQTKAKRKVPRAPRELKPLKASKRKPKSDKLSEHVDGADGERGQHVPKTAKKVTAGPKKEVKNSLQKTKPLPERPVCTECGKQFSSRKTYRYHINVLHKGQNRYPCPHCGKEYQWKSNLWRHIKNHKAVASGELYCAPCDRSFSSVATLRQHQRASRNHVREADFSFMCTTCGARFVSASRLRDHVDWEHLQRAKHRCRLCDKAFKSGTSLYAHAKTVHARSSRLLCHVCGQRYQSAAKLKYHISAMHTRAAPYSCGTCGAAFRWYSSLYRHARQLHDKVKPSKKVRRTAGDSGGGGAVAAAAVAAVAAGVQRAAEPGPPPPPAAEPAPRLTAGCKPAGDKDGYSSVSLATLLAKPRLQFAGQESQPNVTGIEGAHREETCIQPPASPQLGDLE